MRYRAVAGTSIGAIIASLVAAGYESSDLYSKGEDGETGLLSEDLEKRLLDEREYRRVCRLRDHLKWLAGAPRHDGVAGSASRRSKMVGMVLSRFRLSWLVVVAGANLSFIPYLLHARVLRDLWLTSGAVRTDLIREWLDQVLRERVNVPASRPVTFADLRIDLRVVATDLTAGNVVVFGQRQTPDASVADAVVASMAYPFFFRPVVIKDAIFVDGGIASNAPAWVLDDLRDEADERIPTFALRLLDPIDGIASAPNRPGDRLHLRRLAGRFVPSALGSRASMELRRIEQLHLMELRTNVRTLDFEEVNRDKAATVETGYEGVKAYLNRRIGPRDPADMERALRAFIGVVADLFASQGTVRAYAIQPVDESRCRVVYAAMLEGDADDSLVMRLDSRSQALSLQVREPVLLRCSEIPTSDRQVAATKYVHASRPASVRHAYCIPILRTQSDWSLREPMDRPEPQAAVCFDFDEGDDHLLLDPEVEDKLVMVAQTFGEYWSGRREDPEETADSPEGESGDEGASGWLQVPDAPGFHVSSRKTRRPWPEFRDRLDQLVKRIEGAI